MSSTSAEKGSGGTELAVAARPSAYELGYGDFCFLRLVDRYPKPPTGVVDPEFIRLGTFPFMRLPQELRDNIYEYVLAPLLSYTFIKGDRRHLVLRINSAVDEYYRDKLWKADAILAFLDEWLAKGAMSSEDGEIIKEEQMKVLTLYNAVFPPTRARYELTFPVNSVAAKMGDEVVWEKISPTNIASIRNLSNASYQIRGEFGKIAWGRSFLGIDNDYVTGFAGGLACLKERPAIWKGLKSLSISFRDPGNNVLHCVDGCEILSEKCMSENGLLELIEFMNQHLQLDFLRLNLHMIRDHILLVLDSPIELKWVGAVRSLHCAGKFHICVDVLPGRCSAVSRPSSKKWRSVMKKELEEFLKPLVLTDTDREARDNPFALSKPLEFYDRLQPDGSFDRVSAEVKGPQFLFEKYDEYPPDEPIPPHTWPPVRVSVVEENEEDEDHEGDEDDDKGDEGDDRSAGNDLDDSDEGDGQSE